MIERVFPDHWTGLQLYLIYFCFCERSVVCRMTQKSTIGLQVCASTRHVIGFRSLYVVSSRIEYGLVLLQEAVMYSANRYLSITILPITHIPGFMSELLNRRSFFDSKCLLSVRVCVISSWYVAQVRFIIADCVNVSRVMWERYTRTPFVNAAGQH